MAVDAQGHFSIDTGLPTDETADGSHTVHLVATDQAGNVSSPYDLTFVLDTRPALANPNLEAAVREALGLPPDHRITKTNLLHLTTLSADTNRIDSLAGLEFATNLTELSLTPYDGLKAGHRVAGLDTLAGLPGLKSLALVGASLTTADLASLAPLTGLETLDLRYNQITDVTPLASLHALHTLSLYANPVTDLSPLAGMLLRVDLPPNRPESATTIPDLARALHELPLEIYEYVLNTFAYQPYAGAMKERRRSWRPSKGTTGTSTPC